MAAPATEGTLRLSHRKWRALAKKLRRKRKRREAAEAREKQAQEEEEARQNSPRYQRWLEEQEEMESFAVEQEAFLLQKERERWEERERKAQEEWQEKKKREAQIQADREEQERKIREEWEWRQKREEEEREAKEKKEREMREKQEASLNQLLDFLAGDTNVPPPNGLLYDVDPNKETCPFFKKTGVCRFREHCSRNHPRPIVSRCLLIPNFYTHFAMEQMLREDYDCDIGLEYEDSETYQHFLDFYEDTVLEFQSAGRLVQFRVCCNAEPHLRGNVYAQYETEREAVNAFRMFNGRWYAGRQLSVQFVQLVNWKAAICGLFFRKRCPKGRSCNFLHVFRNPRNEFSRMDVDTRSQRTDQRSWWRRSRRSRSKSRERSSRRHAHRSRSEEWRWSESPEWPTGGDDDDESTAATKRHDGRHVKERHLSRSRHKKSSKHKKRRSRSKSPPSKRKKRR